MSVNTYPFPPLPRSLLLLFLLLSHACCPVAGADVCSATPLDARINEFHYDNASADVDERVEVRAPAGTDLTGWALWLYNGRDGRAYATLPLSGAVANFVAGIGFLAHSLPPNTLQNDAGDGIALVDPAGAVADFVCHEGAVKAADGPAAGRTCADVGVPKTTTMEKGTSLQLAGCGADEKWVAAKASFGSVNAAQSFACRCDPAPAPEQSSSVAVNEFHYDNAGRDEAEAVEIRAPAGTDLSGWTLLLYNGRDAAVYKTIPLAGVIANAGDGVGVKVFPAKGIQNGPDGIALVDPGGGVREFLCYEGTFTASDGPAKGETCVDVGVKEDDKTPKGRSVQLTGCGDASKWVSSQSSFGAINAGQTFDCPPGLGGLQPGPGTQPPNEVKKVYEVQGTGLSSEFEGQQVTVTGFVTAVDTKGFYIQDPVGDGDISTSDALFLYAPDNDNAALSAGDGVSVSGKVTEFVPRGRRSRNQGTTQVWGEEVSVTSKNNALPAAVTIGHGGLQPPTDTIEHGLAFWERLEGMRVRLVSPRLVAPTTQRGAYYVVVDNGDAATTLSSRGALVLTRADFNPEIVGVDKDAGVFRYKTQQLRTGATLSDVVGVVAFEEGRYIVIPTEPFMATDGNIERQTSTLVGGPDAVTVASFNLHNFVKKEKDRTKRAGPIAELIVENLRAPDVLALQELLDDSGSLRGDGVTGAAENLQAIVDAVADLGGPTYEAVDNPYIGDGTSGGIPGGNIRVGFLYNAQRVKLIETAPVADPAEQQSRRGPFAGSRPPLAALFSFNGEKVQVVNVHFSSKLGSTPLFGTEQPVEARQDDPSVNGNVDDRLRQVEGVKAFLAGSPHANQIVVGDFNEFIFNAPLKQFPGMYNLAETLPERERYTYIFTGNSQMIDHMLVSQSLKEGAKFEIVHVAAEFPKSVSDHDPLVARLVPSRT